MAKECKELMHNHLRILARECSAITFEKKEQNLDNWQLDVMAHFR
jgi:hypothetical protein